MRSAKKALGVFVVGLVATLFLPSSVKAAEMSDEFKSFLNKDGEFVVNAAKGTTEEDLAMYLDFIYTNADLPYSVCWDKVADDLNSFELGIYCWGDEEDKKETHTVNIKYNYDKKVNETINNYLDTTLKGKTKFKVSDLELVSYWLHNAGGPNDVLALYSGELKRLLDYKNIELFADGRAGNDDKFITSNMGFGTFQSNGIIYKLITGLGATADHIIYIDENVGNTKEEVIEAVQKRMDDYFGKEKVNIIFGGDSIYDLYIDEYDADISSIETEYLPVKEAYELAEQKENEYCAIDNNGELCAQYRDERLSLWANWMNLKSEYEYAIYYKENFIEEWNKPNGSYAFLKEALNGWYFIAEVTTGDSTSMYHFMVQKDSSKMVEPIIKTVDSVTNVEISTNANLPLDTMIQATKLTSGTEYERIVKLLNLTDNLTFDLNLYSNSLDKYITKLENGTFEVRIPVPADFKGQDLVVYYVNKNGEKEEHKLDEDELKKGYAVFNTNHFSIYTLGYKGNSTKVENPNTFDGIGNTILMTIISVLGLVTLTIVNRKNKVMN